MIRREEASATTVHLVTAQPVGFAAFSVALAKLAPAAGTTTPAPAVLAAAQHAAAVVPISQVAEEPRLGAASRVLTLATLDGISQVAAGRALVHARHAPTSQSACLQELTGYRAAVVDM